MIFWMLVHVSFSKKSLVKREKRAVISENESKSTTEKSPLAKINESTPKFCKIVAIATDTKGKMRKETQDFTR